MTLLFLHGLGQTGKDWQAVTAELPDYASIAPDLAKDGLLPDSFEDLQAEVREIMAEQDGDLVLVGLSLGGMLALSLLPQAPVKLKGLVVIAGQYKFKGNLAYRLQSLLFRCFPQKAFARHGMSKSNLINFYKGMRDFDLTEALRECHLPVLLLCGEKDEVNRKAAEELSALLPNARLQILPNAKHEVNRDQPKALAEGIRGFLAEIPYTQKETASRFED